MFLSFLVIFSCDELICDAGVHKVLFFPAVYLKVKGRQRLEADCLTSWPPCPVGVVHLLFSPDLFLITKSMAGGGGLSRVQRVLDTVAW